MLTTECFLAVHYYYEVLPPKCFARKCVQTETRQQFKDIIQLCLKAGNETCYKGQEYIKPPPLQQTKTNSLVVKTSSYAATNMTNAGGYGGLSRTAASLEDAKIPFRKLALEQAEGLPVLLVRRNDPPPPSWSLPLHIHLLHII